MLSRKSPIYKYIVRLNILLIFLFVCYMISRVMGTKITSAGVLFIFFVFLYIGKTYTGSYFGLFTRRRQTNNISTEEQSVPQLSS